jgi:hypothetical protein
MCRDDVHLARNLAADSRGIDALPELAVEEIVVSLHVGVAVAPKLVLEPVDRVEVALGPL